MPKLVRLYIKQVFIGFALSAVFVGLLLWFNIGNLAHLIAGSDIGWIAVLMLFIFNGIVFAGVQFAISVMRLEERPEPPGPGGTRVGLALQPVPVVAERRDRHDREGA